MVHTTDKTTTTSKNQSTSKKESYFLMTTSYAKKLWSKRWVTASAYILMLTEAKLKTGAGWTWTVDPKQFCREFDIPKSSFYRALSILHADGDFKFSWSVRGKVSMSIGEKHLYVVEDLPKKQPVSDVGQENQGCKSIDIMNTPQSTENRASILNKPSCLTSGTKFPPVGQPVSPVGQPVSPVGQENAESLTMTETAEPYITSNNTFNNTSLITQPEPPASHPRDENEKKGSNVDNELNANKENSQIINSSFDSGNNQPVTLKDSIPAPRKNERTEKTNNAQNIKFDSDPTREPDFLIYYNNHPHRQYGDRQLTHPRAYVAKCLKSSGEGAVEIKTLFQEWIDGSAKLNRKITAAGENPVEIEKQQARFDFEGKMQPYQINAWIDRLVRLGIAEFCKNDQQHEFYKWAQQKFPERIAHVV